MADWHDYIKDIDYTGTYEEEDRYGRRYISVPIEFTDDMEYEAASQLCEYLPTDDCYMNPYLLRYLDDGSTEIEVEIEQDWGSRSRCVSSKLDLDDEIREALDQIEI